MMIEVSLPNKRRRKTRPHQWEAAFSEIVRWALPVRSTQYVVFGL
jgi:hypothetical protein